MVPGLTDAHCHIFGIGEREMNLNLEGTDTLEAFLAKVKERVGENRAPANGSPAAAGSKHFGNRRNFRPAPDLDKIAPDNPVLLTRADGHAAIANSAALENAEDRQKHAELLSAAKSLKDKQTGEPTGMLIDKAQELVAQSTFRSRPRRNGEQAFVLGVKREIELGWCQIQNAGSDSPMSR